MPEEKTTPIMTEEKSEEEKAMDAKLAEIEARMDKNVREISEGQLARAFASVLSEPPFSELLKKEPVLHMIMIMLAGELRMKLFGDKPTDNNEEKEVTD